MSINLSKGQKINLSKEQAGLRHIMVGLGWDEVQQAPKGFLSSLFSAPKQDIDCDASAFLISEGKLYGGGDVVYFGNLAHSTQCVIHQGDNLTGAGDGDDEQIFVDLANLPDVYEKIVFVVNIYQARERGQHFGLIRNAFIRLVDADTGREICKYNLSENYSGMTAMIFGEVIKTDNEWQFNAIGQPTTDNSISELATRYGLR